MKRVAKALLPTLATVAVFELIAFLFGIPQFFIGFVAGGVFFLTFAMNENNYE